ncbi:hypothetical protein [Kitasatospora sp. MBT63]|uniref:hypothetical protein n=1 Tax=Kitasatospora sp. MBT63 TaxID=1444768 RepID=UPI00053A350C|nr:hypothetical protein [Kitasatospora sp. MBT63]
MSHDLPGAPQLCVLVLDSFPGHPGQVYLDTAVDESAASAAEPPCDMGGRMYREKTRSSGRSGVLGKEPNGEELLETVTGWVIRLDGQGGAMVLDADHLETDIFGIFLVRR